MSNNLYFKFALFLLIGFFVLHLADLEYQSNFSMLAEEDQGLVISEYFNYKTTFLLLLIPMMFINCIEYVRLKVTPLRKKEISKCLLLGTFIPILIAFILLLLPTPVRRHSSPATTDLILNLPNKILTLAFLAFGFTQIIRVGELIYSQTKKIPRNNI